MAVRRWWTGPVGAYPVLLYHGIAEAAARPAEGAKFWVAAAQAAAQWCWLRDQGPGVATLAEAWAGRGEGRAVITFDDGGSSDYEAAYPALQTCGLSATFFVNPARVGQVGFASWAHLTSMSRNGMAIASHGWDHGDLTQPSEAGLREQLRRSKQEIEQHTGERVRFLAAPYGYYDRRLARIAGEEGFDAVCTSTNRWARAGGAEVPRVAVYGRTTLGQFAALAAGQAGAYWRRRARTWALARAGHALYRWRQAEAGRA